MDVRLRWLLMARKCTIAVAEAASKLPPKQQQALVELFHSKGAERLTMADIREVKSARTSAAIAALPERLFTGPDTLARPEPETDLIDRLVEAAMAALLASGGLKTSKQNSVKLALRESLRGVIEPHTGE
jgi:hypothetical protein